MATVTTNITSNGNLRTWTSPARQDGSFGEIVFTGAATVAAKGAADESHVITTFTLPRNYYWRIMFIDFFITAGDTATFVDYEPAMRGQYTENQVTAANFQVYNDHDFRTGNEAFKFNPDSVTQDFCTFFTASNDLQARLVNAAQGVSQVRMDWMDTSADTSLALGVFFNGRAIAYSVNQGREERNNSPTLVVS